MPDSNHCGCKVGRNAARYGIKELDNDLGDQRRKHQASLRDLADYVNAQFLDAAIDATNATVAGDATAIYHALTSDEIPTHRQVEVTDQLTAIGIDVEQLTDDFVSYQAIRHHLQNCLDIDTSRSGVESLEEGLNLIQWARQRAETVISRTITRLQRLGILTTGGLDVTVTVSITCESCNKVYRPTELLDQGHCACPDQ